MLDAQDFTYKAFQDNREKTHSGFTEGHPVLFYWRPTRKPVRNTSLSIHTGITRQTSMPRAGLAISWAY